MLSKDRPVSESLFTSRICHKGDETEEAEVQGDKTKEDTGKLNSLANYIMSFSVATSFRSLATTKCKLWDDRELDVLEGYKFLNFALG